MNADLEAIAHYLHQHIPLTGHMQVGVRAVDKTGIRLRAPLAPNINHRQTAFGGSVAGLKTIVLPLIRAGVHFRPGTLKGKFQGLMIAATPNGRRTL